MIPRFARDPLKDPSLRPLVKTMIHIQLFNSLIL